MMKMEKVITQKIDTETSLHREDMVLNWMDNPDVQKLLDAISSIIAEEYIEVAKKNKNIFGGGKCE